MGHRPHRAFRRGDQLRLCLCNPDELCVLAFQHRAQVAPDMAMHHADDRHLIFTRAAKLRCGCRQCGCTQKFSPGFHGVLPMGMNPHSSAGRGVRFQMRAGALTRSTAASLIEIVGADDAQSPAKSFLRANECRKRPALPVKFRTSICKTGSAPTSKLCRTTFPPEPQAKELSWRIST
jgi:hypothetical protein